MKAGYTIEHTNNDNTLGDRCVFADVCNYPNQNKVSITYWFDESSMKDYGYTVAIFRIKPKTSDHAEKRNLPL